LRRSEVVAGVRADEQIGLTGRVGRAVPGRGGVDAGHRAPGVQRREHQEGQPDQENERDEPPPPAARTRAGVAVLGGLRAGAAPTGWAPTPGVGLAQWTGGPLGAGRAFGAAFGRRSRGAVGPGPS
jgi:hypothetical protein